MLFRSSNHSSEDVATDGKNDVQSKKHRTEEKLEDEITPVQRYELSQHLPPDFRRLRPMNLSTFGWQAMFPSRADMSPLWGLVGQYIGPHGMQGREMQILRSMPGPEPLQRLEDKMSSMRLYIFRPQAWWPVNDPTQNRDFDLGLSRPFVTHFETWGPDHLCFGVAMLDREDSETKFPWRNTEQDGRSTVKDMADFNHKEQDGDDPRHHIYDADYSEDYLNLQHESGNTYGEPWTNNQPAFLAMCMHQVADAAAEFAWGSHVNVRVELYIPDKTNSQQAYFKKHAPYQIGRAHV